MDKEEKIFRIVVLEDSEFYNDLFTRQLKHYTGELATLKGCSFEIHSYTSAVDCLRNLRQDTDIAFVDYYLGGGMNGSDVLEKIKQHCIDCKVVIISHVKNFKTSYSSITEGALEFLFKDVHAIPASCYIVEDLVNTKLGRVEN